MKVNSFSPSSEEPPSLFMTPNKDGNWIPKKDLFEVVEKIKELKEMVKNIEGTYSKGVEGSYSEGVANGFDIAVGRFIRALDILLKGIEIDE